MMFKSYFWALVALLWGGTAVWDVAPDAATQETEMQFEAKDGGGRIPPP